MKACFNGRDILLGDDNNIDELLSEAKILDDIELWLNAENGESLCALINSACGWLMFLRFPEDTGFSSRSKIPKQDSAESLSFRLSNGQEDYYPANWTMDRSIVFEAIKEFARTSKRPKLIDWHNDSE